MGKSWNHGYAYPDSRLKSGDENPDMHIHDSKIYPSDSVEYYTYFKEYRQKYEIVKNEEHMRSMEPEEVE